MSELLLTVFLASLLGSLHCAGMCGPFAMFAVSRGKSLRSFHSSLFLHLTYHGGRLIAYLLLGAVAGAIGATLTHGGRVFGLEFVAGVMAGILLIGIGGHRILTLLGVCIPNLPGITFFSRMLASGQLAISRWLPGTRALAMGLFSALLPCGWLYAFVAVAVGTGQVAAGVAVLFVFWLGTVPLLAGLGAGLGPLLSRTGRMIQIATASLIILLGVVSIAGRWNLSPSRAMAGPIVDQHTAVPSEPTCHH